MDKTAQHTPRNQFERNKAAWERIGAERDRLLADKRELVAGLKALTEAEWMVTHDWGGDRPAVLEQARALLSKHGG